MFSTKMLSFYRNLDTKIRLPKGISWIDPFSPEVLQISKAYHNKFYHDNKKRTFLMGINPGRFGAGVTGIPFTDPIQLESVMGLKNDLQKRHELSSIFIHEMIEEFGGVYKFSKEFYISSVCPLGFIKDGKNINYYDDRVLEKRVTPFIKKSLEDHIKIGANTDKVISLGMGKNYKFLKALNEKYNFFEEVIPLPHPRWIMQYRRKDKEMHIQSYLDVLNRI